MTGAAARSQFTPFTVRDEFHIYPGSPHLIENICTDSAEFISTFRNALPEHFCWTRLVEQDRNDDGESIAISRINMNGASIAPAQGNENTSL